MSDKLKAQIAEIEDEIGRCYEPQWISVDEQLPDEDQVVTIKGDVWRFGRIVKCDAEEVTRYYGRGVWERDVEQDEDYMKVTHWKPKE